MPSSRHAAVAAASLAVAACNPFRSPVEGAGADAGARRPSGARRDGRLPENREGIMLEQSSVLNTLYARFDALAISRAGAGGSREAHAAILDRLASNRRGAESMGWTACALERDGGMGRLRLLGFPPGGSHRMEVPDPR